MVAQYADESNLIAEARDIPRKLDVLAEHCATLGRHRDDLTVSCSGRPAIAPTMEEAHADLAAYFQVRGIDLARDADDRAPPYGPVILGDPDTVGEAAHRRSGPRGGRLHVERAGQRPRTGASASWRDRGEDRGGRAPVRER